MVRTSAAGAAGGEGGGGDGCLGPWLLCVDGGPAREESVASGRSARRRSTRAFLVVVAMGEAIGRSMIPDLVV